MSASNGWDLPKFLLLTFGGITPRRPLISIDKMESLIAILSPPIFKPVMVEKS